MTHRRGKEEETSETDEERNIDLEIYNLFTSPSIAIEKATQELERTLRELYRRRMRVLTILTLLTISTLIAFVIVLLFVVPSS